MKKELFISEFQTVDGTDQQSYVFVLKHDGEEILSGGNSMNIHTDEEDRNIELRKTCDEDIEIFVEGVSIGFGALNKGLGMTSEELEARAETPEAE